MVAHKPGRKGEGERGAQANITIYIKEKHAGGYGGVGEANRTVIVTGRDLIVRALLAV